MSTITKVNGSKVTKAFAGHYEVTIDGITWAATGIGHEWHIHTVWGGIMNPQYGEFTSLTQALREIGMRTFKVAADV